ncbi:CAP-Gly domain-containing linker protein 1 [Eupeodes corollae]|uniref:CAP-Gly domain-containing linker protein 1 n=1 Tax=Eupeodes corollae TaxID=290404 RepID=UPI00248FED1D|nr:CAP-Gly domain-containing linker protein 1 [Eupeodes corollae]
MTTNINILPPDTNFEEIKNSFEIIIKKIEHELDSNKEEQAKLKEQVQNELENNNRIISNINSIQPASAIVSDQNCKTEHKQLTDDAITNLSKQVEHLKEERSTIRQLWKTSQETITNLEVEIQNYRKQLFKPSAFAEIKYQYSTAIKNLQNIIQNQKNELAKQSQIIRDQDNEKNQANIRIKELQAIIQDQKNKLCENQQLEQINSNLKHKLQEVLHTNSELELSTTLAKGMVDERFVREKKALEKLQEALLIAETAVAEKEESIKREQVIKEECETLASTIGQVMEEAARKVEKDVVCLRAQYEEKEKALMKKHNEVLQELDKQVQSKRLAEARCKEIEAKLNDVLRANNRLDSELQIASQAIIAMELKLEATENLMKADKTSDRFCEEREQQLRQYIENNKQLKERWKNTIEDVTTKFSNEIQRLQKENSNLKAEIHAQRLKVDKTNH